MLYMYDSVWTSGHALPDSRWRFQPRPDHYNCPPTSEILRSYHVIWRASFDSHLDTAFIYWIYPTGPQDAIVAKRVGFSLGWWLIASCKGGVYYLPPIYLEHITPTQDAIVTTRMRNILRVGESRTNLHLPLLHPWSLTCNLKISPWKRRFLLEIIIFRFHSLNFGGVLGGVLLPQALYQSLCPNYNISLNLDFPEIFGGFPFLSQVLGAQIKLVESGRSPPPGTDSPFIFLYQGTRNSCANLRCNVPHCSPEVQRSWKNLRFWDFEDESCLGVSTGGKLQWSQQNTVNPQTPTTS